MTTKITTMVDISTILSDNIGAYIIFISLVFLSCFIALGYQLLNIFKTLLLKIVEDIQGKIANIEEEIRDIKHSLIK